jgi:hypothetical protein
MIQSLQDRVAIRTKCLSFTHIATANFIQFCLVERLEVFNSLRNFSQKNLYNNHVDIFGPSLCQVMNSKKENNETRHTVVINEVQAPLITGFSATLIICR